MGRGVIFGQNEKGQFIRRIDSFDQAIKNIQKNIKNKYTYAGKRAMYLALDGLGRRIVERVINEHEITAWYNEPYPDRQAGDLESTLTWFCVPAPGEEQFLTPEALNRFHNAYNEAVAKKHMTIGMRLWRRDGDNGEGSKLSGTRILGQSEFERHHQNPVEQRVSGDIEVAKLYVTTPMEYAIYVEGGTYNGIEVTGRYPIVHRIMLEEAAKLPGNFMEYFKATNIMATTYIKSPVEAL